MFTLALAAFAAVAAAQTIDQPQPFVSARVSSAAPDGSNFDMARVAPRASHTVADLRGPGRIVHMWFTINTAEADYLRTTRLKLYWDGAAEPAVEVPFGDFHLLGHGKVRPISSHFITVEARPELNTTLRNPNVAGFNSWFPMPFAKGARIVVENASPEPLVSLYYQIDYQKWPRPPSPLRFHTQHRRSPAAPLPPPDEGRNTARNTDGAANHLILDARGRGHLVGVALHVDTPGAGWWEGDEMMWIDGEARPSLAGTGTEDYFGAAWGFRREFNTPYHGLAMFEHTPGRLDWRAGLYSLYRFHVVDPVTFTKSLRVSIERGHNNVRRDAAYASVAYYYVE
jgi:hypothetical protein